MLRLASEGGDITNRRLATEALRMAAVTAAGDVRWDSAIGRAGIAAASSILDPLARTAVRDIGRLSTQLDEAGTADLPLYRAAWNATALSCCSAAVALLPPTLSQAYRERMARFYKSSKIC